MSTSNADIGGPVVSLPISSIGNIDGLDSIDSIDSIDGIDGGVGAEVMTTEKASTAPTPNPATMRDGRRSSSEEKDLTPAQSRRKAQNRAA